LAASAALILHTAAWAFEKVCFRVALVQQEKLSAFAGNRRIFAKIQSTVSRHS
jgi:hypothetical protein